MITRAGRVVLMDFGIARAVTEKKTGTLSGTPAYMSPEQLSGDRVDARTDVFAAGIVLAELVSGEGIGDRSSRERLWAGVREEPPRFPETPWNAVLKSAVSKDPEARFGTARALAQALEEVTLRGEGDEDRRPYPGLRSFTEAEAPFFFGREVEVETAWKKLKRLHLVALIGSSGAGKSSLIHAGLVRAKPDGWGLVVAAPGGRPFTSLARALVPELAGAADAVSELVQMEDLDIAVKVLTRWRKRHEEALLVLDQFEELFTLNPPDVQARFSELVGRMVLEADVRVLLSMRDDFLLHCHDHEPLEPVFSELVPLKPPGGDALRRAVVQPALLCGYRFEDDALIEEMLSQVTEERGALPLLAFTVSCLWDEREREAGLLTRQAYREIGGVGGALAQHAEATLVRIGVARAPIVHEVFRNLVTAQGTRVAREIEELLSVFGPDQEVAREVVRELVDARLLTQFEVSAVEGSEEEPQPRVEIIHESLLSAWPRLVRWRTQDAAGAQLRDQLRQAAQLWQQRGRPEELLWTGASFREFELWRERYPGGLTTTEEAFATGMVQYAERRRRRRRILSVAAVAVLLSVASVLGMLWRQSETARQEAVVEAERREAAQLVALGRLRLEEYPSAAVAYALASLEKRDNAEGRRFAVEALSRGPTAFVLSGEVAAAKFSPDGRWLATKGPVSGIRLWSHEGGPPRVLGGGQGTIWDVGSVQFGPASDVLVSSSGNVLRFWSLPEGKELRHVELEGHTISLVRESRLITFTTGPDGKEIVRSWPLEGGEPRLLARWDARDVTQMGNLAMSGAHFWSVDESGEQTTFAREDALYVSRLEDLESAAGARLLGNHSADVLSAVFHPAGDRVVAVDKDGKIRFWPLAGGSATLERFLGGQPPDQGRFIDLDASGNWLAAATAGPHSTSDVAYLWDLTGPPDADPFVVRNSEMNALTSIDFHPRGRWIATTSILLSGVLWPLNRSYPSVLQGQSPPFINVRFTPGREGPRVLVRRRDGPVLAPVSGGRRTKPDPDGDGGSSRRRPEHRRHGWKRFGHFPLRGACFPRSHARR